MHLAPMDNLCVHVFRGPNVAEIFSYFSAKTYVVGAQKNRLIETVL